MINVRNGVFETNSSSMHSLVVQKEEGTYMKEDVEYDLYINKHGYGALYDLEFGRTPFDVLTTFKTKAAYAFASLCEGTHREVDLEKDPKYNEIQKISVDFLQSLGINEFVGFSLPYDFQEVYEDKKGNEYLENVVWEDNSGKCTVGNKVVHHAGRQTKTIYCGYVDHQSAGLLNSFLVKNNVTLKEFLTEKKYIVIIDGDEYCIWDKLKSTRLIDPDGIVKEA